MAYGTVHYEDGGEWLVSNCEVIIPVWTLEKLSAEEIGERVLSLWPRVLHLQARIRDCPGMMDTLENLEAHFLALDELRAAREEARKRSKVIRKELRKVYDRTFIALGRRDGFSCQGCGKDRDIHIEHITAVINGGTNDLENLQLLCQSCNSKKGDRQE